jgi:hypothetical protein
LAVAAEVASHSATPPCPEHVPALEVLYELVPSRHLAVASEESLCARDGRGKKRRATASGRIELMDMEPSLDEDMRPGYTNRGY